MRLFGDEIGDALAASSRDSNSENLQLINRSGFECNSLTAARGFNGMFFIIPNSNLHAAVASMDDGVHDLISIYDVENS
jgi:hypothetical protein